MSKELIKIFDTTLRDGQQGIGSNMNPKEKIKIAKYLEIKCKIRPNLLFGRILRVKIFFPKLIFRIITSFFHILKLKTLQYRKVFVHLDLYC